MRADPPAGVRRRIDAFAPVALAELDARAALQTRVDRKYVVEWTVLADLLDAMAPDFHALQTAAGRLFAYRSRYFDSGSYGAFRAHVQGRRRRYKCRARHYVDADRYVFEVKLKGARGETVKHALPCAAREFEDITARTARFANTCLHDAYGHAVADLRPSLETTYRRMTLVAADGSQRVTADFGLRFDDGRGARSALHPDYVIVETKSAGMAGGADGLLWGLGARPVSVSKYCVGLGLLRDDVKTNQFRRVMRSYFAT